MSLLDKIRSARRQGGYDPGDAVRAQIKDAEGVEHETEFEIETYCGGGFAGQVYRGRCVSAADGWLPVGQVFALKFFSPRSGFRRLFRDLLYRLCFVSPFPYQYNEDSVRAALFLTKLLQIVARVAFGTAAPINEMYGTFWDEHVGAYAELNEWVPGGVTEPAVDPEILTRRALNRRVKQRIRDGSASAADLVSPPGEMAAKRRFMDAICRICAELGLDDLARQVYWWTGMSQANVLTRRQNLQVVGQPDFVWVDRRPGLPGLVLSLGDIPLFARAIGRGSIPPFDRIDFRKLRAWQGAPDRQEWETLVDRLEETDRRYRATQVDPLRHHVRLLSSRGLRRSIAANFIDYWHRSGRIDEATRDRLMERRPLLYAFNSFLSVVPLVGRRLQKWVGNAAYREHVRSFLRDGRYRRDYLDAGRVATLKVWLADRRTTERRAEKDAGSFLAFYEDRILCGWMPPAWQMFLTDGAYQIDCLRRLVTNPFRYVFVGDYRRQVNINWLIERTREDVKRGFLTQADADEYVKVAGHRTIQQYLTGLMVMAAIRASSVSEIVILLGLGTVIKNLKVMQVQNPGLWVAVALFLLVSISPAGLLRFVYCLVAWGINRDVPYGTATVMAPIRGVGDLSFAAQIAKTHPGFSGYLLTSTACRIAEHVPVFGERGGLLGLWVVTVMLSWPASLKTWWIARRANGPDDRLAVGGRM